MPKATAAAASQKKAPRIATEALPRKTLQEAERVAKALFDNVGSKSAAWDELAGYMTVGTQSNDTKYLFWSAQAYGIITRAEDKSLSLSETGRKIVSPNDAAERLEAIRKAVLTPTVLSKFFTDYNGHPIPAEPHFSNVLLNKFGIPKDRTEEAIKLITANGNYSQILVLAEAGAQPVVKLDGSAPLPSDPSSEPSLSDNPTAEISAEATDWDKEVFYITPIGDEGTDIRKHSDMMLKHLIEPVCQQFGLKAIRADKIAKSGLINQQVFEHLVHARVAIADLSFGNANAFYELGVRHVCKLPTVQVIRKGDKIPFDVSQGRTIIVDTTDIYTIMDKFDSARREVTEHIKTILAQPKGHPSDDNPVHVYLPQLQVTIPK